MFRIFGCIVILGGCMTAPKNRVVQDTGGNTSNDIVETSPLVSMTGFYNETVDDIQPNYDIFATEEAAENWADLTSHDCTWFYNTWNEHGDFIDCEYCDVVGFLEFSESTGDCYEDDEHINHIGFAIDVENGGLYIQSGMNWMIWGSCTEITDSSAYCIFSSFDDYDVYYGTYDYTASYTLEW